MLKKLLRPVVFIHHLLPTPTPGAQGILSTVGRWGTPFSGETLSCALLCALPLGSLGASLGIRDVSVRVRAEASGFLKAERPPVPSAWSPCREGTSVNSECFEYRCFSSLLPFPVSSTHSPRGCSKTQALCRPQPSFFILWFLILQDGGATLLTRRLFCMRGISISFPLFPPPSGCLSCFPHTAPPLHPPEPN